MAKPPFTLTDLPTGDQVTQYLQQHPPTGPSRWSAWLPMLMMAVAAMLLVGWAHLSLPVALCVLLLGMFIATAVRAGKLKQIEHRLNLAQDHSLMRLHRQAVDGVWQLLPQLRVIPPLHAKAVALLAHNLEQLRAHDAAIAAFDEVISRLPEDHPVWAQLRVQQTLALLACDQLADADASLRRLRQVMDRYAGSPIQAGYHLACLYQQIRTHHFRDAVESRQDALAQLRPLGVDAGLGYGLMALACWEMGCLTGESIWVEEARLWWSRATLLVSPQRLAQRFEELAALTNGVPALPTPADDPAVIDDITTSGPEVDA